MIYSFLRRSLHRQLRFVQHIFNENSVPSCGVIDHNVGDSSDESAVLNDRRARHECVQVGTTIFEKLFTYSSENKERLQNIC